MSIARRVVIGALVVGIVWLLAVGTYAATQNTSEPAHPHPAPAPAPSVTGSADPEVLVFQPKVKPSGVDPRCYSAWRAVNVLACQIQVRDRTKFVARYRQGQPKIARVHPDVDTPKSIARGTSSLTRHGLEICVMSQDTRYSIIEMIVRFMTVYHAHPGPVTESAALQTQAISIQTICPEMQAAYDRKAKL